MTLEVKICGLEEPEGLHAALDAGAHLVGFVFQKTSRHRVTPEQAGALVRLVPTTVKRIGLFVDASDDEIRAVLEKAPLDMLQLHGDETPERIADIRAKTGLPVMVARRIGKKEHLDSLPAYEAVADRLLFDARVGETPTGGTGKSFDWTLLQGLSLTKPWMLAGGLRAENLAEAVRVSGARRVDVSSGVEGDSGVKSPEKIRAFIALAAQL